MLESNVAKQQNGGSDGGWWSGRKKQTGDLSLQ